MDAWLYEEVNDGLQWFTTPKNLWVSFSHDHRSHTGLTARVCSGSARQDVLDVLEMTFLVVFCGEMAVLLMALGAVAKRPEQCCGKAHWFLAGRMEL